VIRVVFDTNIVVSAQFWQGAPRHALIAVRDGRAKLLTSEPLLQELTDVLTRTKFADRLKAVGTTAEALIADHRALVEIVEPAPLSGTVSDDPDDDVVLACAAGGKADYIVSGDDDLLRLETYAEIPICTVNEFLEVLGKLGK
jgi:putative PIN family toxin of toxin-antitoxin system